MAGCGHSVSLAPRIVAFLDTLVHRSVRRDEMSSTRHRAFIAAHLLGAVTLLATFPLYLAWRGAPSPLEVFCCAWLIVPIGIAFFLSRTGRFTEAHLLSGLARSIIVLIVAINTGGIQSPIAVWLVTVPFEAVIAVSRRAILVAAVLATGSALVLVGLGWADLLPASAIVDSSRGFLTALSVAALTGYCSIIALCGDLITHKSRALRQAAEDRYRLLATNMSDVLSRHRRNGTVSFMSPGAEAMFGAPIEQLMGHGLFERVHVADRPAYLTAVSDAATGAQFSNVEFRVRCGPTAARKGDAPPAVNYIWVEMRCKPLRQSDGVPGNTQGEIVAVLWDITERKAREQALGAARAAAEEAEASKSRFLATMSHELRTPLNAIIGFSEMIVQEKELGVSADKRLEYARLIHDSGRHLLSVVNGILDMSKMESGKFEIVSEPFEPRDAILACCDLMALKARDSGLDLAVRAAEHLPSMVGDERALKQILINLLSNAIKFTERGGSVTVSASAEDGRLVLKVADTGVGIAADDLKHIGDPFFQSGKTYQRRHEGTGLGLSIVKGLVGLYKGQMSVDSRLDEGTTIVIVLPLDLDAAQAHTAANVTILTPARNEPTDIQVKRSA